MFEQKEEELFCKRLIELSNIAYQKGISCYTNFLNLNELNLFDTIKNKLAPVGIKLWGGFEYAERKIICFYDNTNNSIDFPIKTIKIEPVHQKYKDVLSHRDYLGAILNLGIERCKVGDIVIEESNAYLFCDVVMSTLIVDQLERVKNTMVICSIIDDIEYNIVPKFQEVSGTVSSIRLDAILSVAYRTSRSSITSLISGKKVYVNNRLIQSNSYVIKEEDIISVRGYGKFIYKGINSQTKKGRYSITVLKYI